MNKENVKLRITDLAKEDRPREKMVIKGISSLSDSELIAILIGSGNRNETAVELSQRILSSTNNNLNTLGKLEIKDFVKRFKGIGEAKAITIIAALELGRRRKLVNSDSPKQIKSSMDIYNIFHPLLGDIKHEEGWILLLNRANKIIKKIQISKGGVTGTIMDIRLIIKEALDNLAVHIALVHNHPSGNTKPSNEDNIVTNKLKKACELLDISLIDHVIICDGSYYSYRDGDFL
jgi:DNA repair protein RadC